MHRNGIRQRLQLLFVKVLPGLIGIGFYFIDWQKLICAVFCRFFGEITQQSTQALAQTFV